MILMLTYDLNKAKDYKKLYAAIEALGETKRDANLDSVWFIATTHSPSEASDRIRQATDSDDTHFICRIKERNGLMNKDVWNWIRAHE